MTQFGQSTVSVPPVEPGSAARAQIQQARMLSSAIRAAAAAVGSRCQEARAAYELARADVIQIRLDELPLEKIREVTQGRLRLNALEQAGYRSVGAVLRAGSYALQSVHGVGPT
ncbi:MAG: hypothetical protein ACRDP7_37000, partial [Trebonia sp.]